MNAIDLIAAERATHKWSADHDDQHTDGSLAVVAATIAVAGTDAKVVDPLDRGSDNDCWGLIKKHHDRLRQLTIAGALIAAEIDREIRRDIKQRALRSTGEQT
jgi:hypothetical protein